MLESASRIQIGDPIPGKNIKLRTVSMIIDPPTGSLLVDQEGNIHDYWYRWIRYGRGYRKVLTHHGGPEGFNDIQRVIDQHQRVIAGYMGVETELEGEPDEQLLKPPFTLKTYAQALRIGVNRVEISGERAWMSDCLYLVERFIRGAAVKLPAADLQSRVGNLAKLQPKFERSRNPYMQSASLHLMEAVEAAQGENRDLAMKAFLNMGQDVTKRVIEISDILAATIQRDSLLENLRNSMEGVVKQVHDDVLRAKERWDQTENDSERQKIILNLTAPLGIGKLSQLTVQPFRSRGGKGALARLPRLGKYWEDGNTERVGRVLTLSSIELINWRQEIQNRIKGEHKLRFPSS